MFYSENPKKSYYCKKQCAPSYSECKLKNCDLSRILEDLKSNNLVYKHTRQQTFNIIFSGKRIEKKIRWLGNIEELAHFIRTLIRHGCIRVKRHEIWLVTCNCFELADGRVLHSQSLKDAEKPTKAALIEQLVSQRVRALTTQ